MAVTTPLVEIPLLEMTPATPTLLAVSVPAVTTPTVMALDDRAALDVRPTTVAAPLVRSEVDTRSPAVNEPDVVKPVATTTPEVLTPPAPATRVAALTAPEAVS
jgi:hypothetical protein